MEAYRPEIIDFDIDLIGFWYVPERVPEWRHMVCLNLDVWYALT